MVSLDCIPDTEKNRNPGFLDQEILVSGFFRDQDHRNSKSNICVKFVRSVQIVLKLCKKNDILGNSIDPTVPTDNLSQFLAPNFQGPHFEEL